MLIKIALKGNLKKIMDTDTANPRRLIQKKVYYIIDMAIVDILNSKKNSKKNLNTSFADDIKTAWLKLTDEEKAYLTKIIKEENSNKKKLPYNISSYELVNYFAKYIIPYNNQPAKQAEKKSFTQMLIWANSVRQSLGKIKKLDQQLHLTNPKKSSFALEKINENYESALNEFYFVYGRPSKEEKRILKFKLLFDSKQELLKHLLKERSQWREILSTANNS